MSESNSKSKPISKSKSHSKSHSEISTSDTAPYENQLRGGVLIDLSAAIIRLIDNQPCCRLVVSVSDEPKRLPFGPFYPLEHRTMEIGLRQWVEAQVGVQIEHAEQLYTFGDRGRHAMDQTGEDHVVSVGYLALTRNIHQMGDDADDTESVWQSLYSFFPWEDWRDQRPEILDETVLPALNTWLNDHAQEANRERVNLAFSVDNRTWDEELVLERYELLYEAGLVHETLLDGRTSDERAQSAGLGQPLQLDHRRILATALGRLRGKMKYRPVIFDLMPETFTLGQLQASTESILGAQLHKQNFRRLVEKSNMVTSTGQISRARGRPAEIFRLRDEASPDRLLSGLRVTPSRSRLK